MYHHIAGIDFNRCEKKTNCANCSEAQQRKCEQELDQSYRVCIHKAEFPKGRHLGQGFCLDCMLATCINFDSSEGA